MPLGWSLARTLSPDCANGSDHGSPDWARLAAAEEGSASGSARLQLRQRNWWDTLNKPQNAAAVPSARPAVAVLRPSRAPLGFDGSEIRTLLEGKRDDIYNFVGGSLNDERLIGRFLHHLALRERLKHHHMKLLLGSPGSSGNSR